MRAPNGQSMPISTNKRYSIVVGGDVLSRCTEFLRAAVEQKTPVIFILYEYDIRGFFYYYRDVDVTCSGALNLFLDEIFEKKGLPYRIGTVVNLLGTDTYHCRIERRRW